MNLLAIFANAKSGRGAGGTAIAWPLFGNLVAMELSAGAVGSFYGAIYKNNYSANIAEGNLYNLRYINRGSST